MVHKSLRLYWSVWLSSVRWLLIQLQLHFPVCSLFSACLLPFPHLPCLLSSPHFLLCHLIPVNSLTIFSVTFIVTTEFVGVLQRNGRNQGRERQRLISYEGLTHMIMEAEKPHNLPPAQWTQESEWCDPRLSSEQEKDFLLLAWIWWGNVARDVVVSRSWEWPSTMPGGNQDLRPSAAWNWIVLQARRSLGMDFLPRASQWECNPVESCTSASEDPGWWISCDSSQFSAASHMPLFLPCPMCAHTCHDTSRQCWGSFEHPHPPWCCWGVLWAHPWPPHCCWASSKPPSTLTHLGLHGSCNFSKDPVPRHNCLLVGCYWPQIPGDFPMPPVPPETTVTLYKLLVPPIPLWPLPGSLCAPRYPCDSLSVSCDPMVHVSCN